MAFQWQFLQVSDFRLEVDKLRLASESMIKRDHYESTQIATRQRRLESSYDDLVKECTRRRTQLQDAGK